MKRSFLVVSFCIAVVTAGAQGVRVNSGFLSDSVKIGEKTSFYLSVHAPRGTTILFPDSTSAYFPFEYIGKHYFPTVTRDSVSKDSVVYTLSTFEIDPVQYLYLPVYQVLARDCTEHYSPTDSIKLIELVADVPDSVSIAMLPLKMDTSYEYVRMEFNYVLLILGIAVVLVVALVAWLIFGARIRKYFRSRALMRNHVSFIKRYNSYLAELRNSVSPSHAESALAIWKRYMEQLEARPYSKLTTRETVRLIRDESLENNLRMVDRAIYGHRAPAVEPLEELRAFAERRFSLKLQEVRHGQ